MPRRPRKKAHKPRRLTRAQAEARLRGAWTRYTLNVYLVLDVLYGPEGE